MPGTEDGPDQREDSRSRPHIGLIMETNNPQDRDLAGLLYPVA